MPRAILEEEAVLRQALDDQVQEQPVVLDVQLGFGWRVEQRRHLALEAFEQLQYQRLLAMEVVVEIARADVQLVGDLQCGNVGLALLVEQLQGGLQNALAGFHPWLLVQLGAKD